MENGLTSAFNDDIRRDQNGQALLEKSKTTERLPLQLKQGAKISAVRNIHRESDQKTDTCMSPSRQVSLVVIIIAVRFTKTMPQPAKRPVTTLSLPVHNLKAQKMLHTGLRYLVWTTQTRPLAGQLLTEWQTNPCSYNSFQKQNVCQEHRCTLPLACQRSSTRVGL